MLTWILAGIVAVLLFILGWILKELSHMFDAFGGG